MLPPVLEIVVVWHPRHKEGRTIARQLFEHFHGTAFSGLIGGAIEVYCRSAGWRSDDDAPRPLPLPSYTNPAGVANAHVVVVVPILSVELAASVEEDDSAWHAYMRTIFGAPKNDPRVGVFAYAPDAAAIDGTRLRELLGNRQLVALTPPKTGDTTERLLSRELTQGIVQLLSNDERLTIFISHTKRHSSAEEATVDALIDDVREVIRNTRLREFFDAADLQPGVDWDEKLRSEAARSALLAIRTDLYPSREWCQREVLLAKREGMPLVILDALGQGEERGSFLMDHAPRLPVKIAAQKWNREDIYRGLDWMVDQCLKRELWKLQQQLTAGDLGLDIGRWAPHAPEPVTFIRWLHENREREQAKEPNAELIVLHPDPPLGPDERRVLQELVTLSGLSRPLAVLTPRLLAARFA